MAIRAAAVDLKPFNILVNLCSFIQHCFMLLTLPDDRRHKAAPICQPLAAPELKHIRKGPAIYSKVFPWVVCAFGPSILC